MQNVKAESGVEASLAAHSIPFCYQTTVKEVTSETLALPPPGFRDVHSQRLSALDKSMEGWRRGVRTALC